MGRIQGLHKRTPFTPQKDSFWSAKGLVLERKRTPFTLQKDSFWKAKGPLLQEAGVLSSPIYIIRYRRRRKKRIQN